MDRKGRKQEETMDRTKIIISTWSGNVWSICRNVVDPVANSITVTRRERPRHIYAVHASFCCDIWHLPHPVKTWIRKCNIMSKELKPEMQIYIYSRIIIKQHLALLSYQLLLKRYIWAFLFSWLHKVSFIHFFFFFTTSTDLTNLWVKFHKDSWTCDHKAGPWLHRWAGGQHRCRESSPWGNQGPTGSPGRGWVRCSPPTPSPLERAGLIGL